MISLGYEVDGHAIAAEIRMERQVHKGSFLLLEGEHDHRRVSRFVHDDCSTVICFGKPNVILGIELLYEDGFSGAVGLIDADFDRILRISPSHEGLVISQHHDFELDVLSSDALARYLAQTADAEKLANIGTAEHFLEDLLARLKPLAALKLANVRENLRYKLGDTRLHEFFDGVAIDVTKMVDSVSQGRFGDAANRAKLTEVIDRFVARDLDLYQATSGHDVCAAIGICLRDRIGKRREPQTWRTEVEMHFRLTYEKEDFEQSAACYGLRRWEKANQPYRILN